MSKKVTELPLATQVDPDDKFLIVQDSDGLSKQAPASLISGGGFGTLAFELDASLGFNQWQAGGAADLALGGGGGSWSIAAAPERGDVFVYTPAGGTTVSEVFMFTPKIPFVGERRDMRIEIELLDATWGSGYFGPFFYGDGTPGHGFAHCGQGGPGEWQSLLNNGVIERDGGTGSGVPGMFAQYTIRGRKPAAAAPFVTSMSTGWNANAYPGGEPRRSGSSSAIRGGVPNFGNNSTLGATWNALACDRVGLMVQSSGGNPPPTQIRMVSFRVWVQ